MKSKIIICPNETKKECLKEQEQRSELINQKYMTKQEFLNHYYFEYDNKTIEYLMKKYNYHIDVCKVYLNNMLYIEDKEYKSKKLNFLKKLKQECQTNGLLITHPTFKKYIENNIVEVKNTYDFDKKEEMILKINREIPKYSFHSKVYEFSNMEKEINFVCQEIRKLLKNNIPLSKIYLVNVTEDYYYTIEKMFKYYHIPIMIPYKESIYATTEVQEYLKTKEIKETNSIPNSKLKSVLGKVSDLEESNSKDKILIDLLKHTYFPNKKYDKAIEIKELKDKDFKDDEYVFLLGFNQDTIPATKKDIDYLSDEEKQELGIYTTKEYNQRERLLIPYLLSKIKNLTITYKLSSPFQKYYPSSLIKDFQLEVINNIEEDYSLSNDYNKIRLGEMLDKFYIYGEKDKNLELLNSNYSINYQSYSNKFTGINKDTYLENLRVPLQISYTSLNSYNECKFKYYIRNVLKIEPYEETFSSFIGTLYHHILSLYKKDHFNFDEAWNNYLEKRELSLKEKILLVRIRKDLNDFLEVLKKQQYLTGYDEEYHEKQVIIPLRKDIQTEFIGYIDKIMFYKKMDDVYFSIIDYKSGEIDTHIEPMKYGLHMQLPIYLYLLHYGTIFQNPIFTGIYYQNILFSYPLWSLKLEEEEKKKYYLQGYSTDEVDILERFDTTYQDSQLIRGMKYSEEKGFGSYAKVIDNDTLLELIKYTKNHIEKKTEEILQADFTIDPKILGKDNISCELCKFQDLCYHTNDDIKRLKKVDDLSFLGGEK